MERTLTHRHESFRNIVLEAQREPTYRWIWQTTSEIVDILRHNASIRDASLGYWANMRIRFSVIDIEEVIHKLEQAVVLLDRFAHRIETNAAMMVHKPNARVNRIAEAYSMVRNAAQDLHTTMSLC